MVEKSIEVSGKTEEDAIQLALTQLGLDRDDVQVQITQRAKSGFLGIGASPAVVRVTYRDGTAAEPAPAPVKPEPAAAPAAPTVRAAERADSAPPTGEAPADGAQRFLTGLFEKMDVSATADVEEADGVLRIQLQGQNMGQLIGRRGETLDAIQHLTSYVVNRGRERRVRVNIDAENYRQKREESLIRLAEKVAGKVLRYRKNMSLEPMNSYERHVIHTALQDYRGVTTHSTGTDPNRRVVVAYSRSVTAPATPAPTIPDAPTTPDAPASSHKEWA